jgi:hypothetical protein
LLIKFEDIDWKPIHLTLDLAGYLRAPKKGTFISKAPFDSFLAMSFSELLHTSSASALFLSINVILSLC